MKCVKCGEPAEYMYGGCSYCHKHLVETKEKDEKSTEELHEKLDELEAKYKKRIEDAKK